MFDTLPGLGADPPEHRSAASAMAAAGAEAFSELAGAYDRCAFDLALSILGRPQAAASAVEEACRRLRRDALDGGPRDAQPGALLLHEVYAVCTDATRGRRGPATSAREADRLDALRAAQHDALLLSLPGLDRERTGISARSSSRTVVARLHRACRAACARAGRDVYGPAPAAPRRTRTTDDERRRLDRPPPPPAPRAATAPSPASARRWAAVLPFSSPHGRMRPIALEEERCWRWH